MQINAITNNQLQVNQQKYNRPSFGKVFPSRLVLQEISADGVESFPPHTFLEATVIRVYNLLARRMPEGKIDKNIIGKLKEVVSDFNPKAPRIRSTGVATEGNSRIVLTGKDAQYVRNIADDSFPQTSSPLMYNALTKTQIVRNRARRVVDEKGNPLAMDVIVKRKDPKSKDPKNYEIVDIDFINAGDMKYPKYERSHKFKNPELVAKTELDAPKPKAKPAKKAKQAKVVAKPEVKANENKNQPVLFAEPKMKQGEFPFMDECINPIKYGMGD